MGACFFVYAIFVRSRVCWLLFAIVVLREHTQPKIFKSAWLLLCDQIKKRFVCLRAPFARLYIKRLRVCLLT